MADWYSNRTATAVVVLVTLASFTAHPALGHLPWAGSSGTDFVEATVNADNYRMRAAALAMKRSPSSDVRDFARELWGYSIEDTRRLKWVLTKEDPYVVLWTQVSPQYLFVLDELVPIRGDAFDQRFIAQQAASLGDALALAEGYARAGDDLDLKEFAARSVPEIKTQLDRITAIRLQHQALARR